ncbi:MAG: N-acetylmuramoyl-L-alanine amidase [Candidatus Moranbacteria bacterium]|nr:N-acetylmuramoyl-L-alanine amidase [Candidatus Moranbacteria bacterium]
MNKKYIFIGGIIIALLGGVSFSVMRMQEVYAPTVADMAAQMERLATQKTAPSSSSGVTEDVKANQMQDTDVATDTKDTLTKETPKEDAQKKSVASSKLDIRNKLVGFGFSVPSKPRTIDTIILHSSYDSVGDDPYSVEGIIGVYKSYGVSAHYLIGRDGIVYRLVKDENIAWHAGVSKMPDGRTDVNDFSIGIELINTKTGEYTDEQYTALKLLIASLKDQYAIKYVLGHDDIAPGRKTDPWGFDWKNL